MAFTSAAQCPDPQPNMYFGGPLGWGGGLSWGQSASCNVTNMNMVCQGAITTEVLNSNNASETNSIVISQKCDPSLCEDSEDCCDVAVVAGSDFEQTNTADMNSVQLTYTSTEAQQQMLLQMAQQSTAVTKGIQLLPQSSTATNIINANMKMQMSIVTNISNECNTTEENHYVYDESGYNTAIFYDNSIKQVNDTNSKCTQVALTKTQLSQTMTAQLAQIASATTAGISLWAFLLIFAIFAAFVLGAFYIGEEFLAFILGAGCIGGAIACLWLGYVKHTAVAWYGFSPGIQNSCPSKFTAVGEAIYYSSSEKAQQDCLDKGYVALDYILADQGDPNLSGDDPGDNPGYATFYTGDYIDLTKMDTCENIRNCNMDEGNKIISFTNPAYANGSDTPQDDAPGDVYLDNDNGNLWYKLPPYADPTNPSKGFDSSPNFDWSQPTNMNGSSGKNNVFDGLSEDDFSKSTNSKTYIWIQSTMKSTQVPNPKESEINASNPTIRFETVSYPPAGEEDMGSSIVGNQQDSASYPVSKDVNQNNITSEDYFLVVFPYGSSITPDDPTLQMYESGQVYKLYPAAQLPGSGEWVPYINGATGAQLGVGALSDEQKDFLLLSDYTWEKPLNTIPGYSLVLHFEKFNWTMFVYQYQKTWLQVLGYSLLGMGIVFIILGIYQNANPKDKSKIQKQKKSGGQSSSKNTDSSNFTGESLPLTRLIDGSQS